MPRRTSTAARRAAGCSTSNVACSRISTSSWRWRFRSNHPRASCRRSWPVWSARRSAPVRPSGGAARRRQPCLCSSRSARGDPSERQDADRQAARVPSEVSSAPVVDHTPSQVTPSTSPEAKPRQADARRRVARPQGVADHASPLEAEVVVPRCGVAGPGTLPRPRTPRRARRINSPQLGRNRRRGSHRARHRAARGRHSCRDGCESRHRPRQSTRARNQIRSVLMRSEFAVALVALRRAGHADTGRRARQAAASGRPAGRLERVASRSH